ASCSPSGAGRGPEAQRRVDAAPAGVWLRARRRDSRAADLRLAKPAARRRTRALVLRRARGAPPGPARSDLAAARTSDRPGDRCGAVGVDSVEEGGGRFDEAEAGYCGSTLIAPCIMAPCCMQ